MSGFFDRMLGRGNQPKSSSSTAKDRLKFVLVHDRMEVAPEKLKAMREEILAVIAKYVPDIDPGSVDISFEQSDRYNNKLIAQIPFTKPRSRGGAEVDENDDFEFEPLATDEEQDDFAFADDSDLDVDGTTPAATLDDTSEVSVTSATPPDDASTTDDSADEETKSD